MPNGLQPTGPGRVTGPEEPSDTDLVARARAGDLRAFDLLVTRHRRAAYRVAWRMTGRHQEADDLSQEAFLRAWKGLRAFRGEASFATWLTRIVVNLGATGRPGRRAWAPIETALVDPADPGLPAPDRVLRDEVRSAVGRLPPRQREVLVLKVYEGWTFAEIGRALGIAIGTAKATFFQAVTGLRGRLSIAAGPAAARPSRPGTAGPRMEVPGATGRGDRGNDGDEEVVIG
jgi:RNA polymerase sigma-70 factor (ECF subfamily)